MRAEVIYMTQAKPRNIPPDMAALPRSKWEQLIHEANLGKEDTQIATRYFIDKECQIDIAIDMLLSRNTIGSRIERARGRIEKLYRS